MTLIILIWHWSDFSLDSTSHLILSNLLFKKFVQLLNPNYKTPTRKRLSNQLLDKIHQEVQSYAKNDDETDGVLMIDGWKNSAANTKLVVCTIHVTLVKSIYLKTWDLTGISETAMILTEIVEEAMTIAKEKYNINIYAVVSDNASSMILMGKSVKIWHVTCGSHSGNLLAKSLIDSQFTECVTSLLREFKQPGPEKELVKRGGKKIILPGETRWCSWRDSLRCCLSNISIMRDIVKDKIITIKPNNLNLLDSQFETQLLDYILICDPICKIINKCQRSETNIADSCEDWFALDIPTDNEAYEKIVEARKNKVLKPIMLVANYLHPVYRGKRFMDLENNKSIVHEFLAKELNVQDLNTDTHIKAFVENTGIFAKLNKKNITSPHVYWFMAKKVHPNLSKLAQRLLKIPASSAGIERLFSNWSFVHSDLRNRLSAERSQKLIEIYYSLKMKYKLY